MSTANLGAFQAAWTLSEEEIAFVKSKASRHRLIFAALLKFFQLEERFPEKLIDIPQVALQHIRPVGHVGAICRQILKNDVISL